MEFKEQIQRILENVPRVYEAGRGSVNNDFANALRGNVSGEAAVVLPDVSPIEHNMKVRVSSKNVLPLPTTGGTERNGVTITHNKDGSITLKGTATENANYLIVKSNAPIEGEYFLTGGWRSKENSDHFVTFSVVINSQKVSAIEKGVKCEIPKGAIITNMAVWFPSGTDFGEGVTIYPQLEPGTTATPYAPPVDVSKVKLISSGKNLLNLTPILGTTVSAYGGTLTCNADGSISGSGTPNAYLTFGEIRLNLPKREYVLSVTGEFNNISCSIYVYDKDGLKLASSGLTSIIRTLKIDMNNYPNYSYCTFEIKRSNNNAPMSGTAYFKLGLGATETEYELPVAPTEYSVNADGTVTGVTSISPTTTLLSDTPNVVIDVEYNRDINKAFAELQQAILSIGGNV